MKHRLLVAPLLVPTLMVAFAASSFSQDNISPAKRVSQFEPFFGAWSAKHKFAISPPGTATVVIGPALNNSFVKFKWSFKPDGGGNLDAIEMMVGWSGHHKELRFWAATFDGRAEGSVSIENNTATFVGDGVSFNGDSGSRKITYSIEDGKLIFHQTQGKQGGKSIPDEKIVMEQHDPGKSEQESEPKQPITSTELLKEIQGTWKLEQSSGSWTVKTVEGNKTKLTRHKKDGSIRAGHNSECELHEHNGVKVFKVTHMEFTEGPQKGFVVPAGFLGDGYIYTVEGDTWTEAQGLVTGVGR